ncbi:MULTISPECIES: peptide chain release factor N(5)-glutamine methyltransferase [Aeromonas]|jgi:release factor glutamine methyltransferase|uniref:peptide chain release factor N(5)-glutamine methyltransferase n=1 Tax=Aeromonas TaxID=642 RepID=UPI000929D2D7|nr:MULTISPECIES: peptide chain release factor N(5)-glutamine methyltransferase [Aeromonas]MBL0527978.1 peptide chain release factor N(5)-glutamine methyltransferase [Aeromonas caviae]MDH0359345.1 peptide chain release factor N(5)-glutamine methyltransferase [Aeromonas caviae]MDX7612270.1 peptide chain release factor N(5)-glutamine methyltransferase [Aeromonas caviae]MDX7818027.1 peptide chain release factor N(5)-glutamine methyltransferase [Aeromonas caviae]MDX7823731.1 peptide chain release f
MQIQQARAHIMATLASGESPRADADALLCHLLDCRRSYLMTWPEHELDAAQQATLAGWLARRLNGEPIAHLIGEREFWSLPLKVSPATLIPRPDTEVLVEQALARLPGGPCALLDLGTGTGAIALALKSERPDADVWAVDRMPAAAALARTNSAALGLPIEVRDGSWFAPLSDAPRFAMIVSNPPYIDGADPHLHEGDVRFEPRSALVAEEQGLADIRLIVTQAPAHLVPGGWLLLEHGWDQGEAVRQLLLQQGYVQVETVRDYGDNERVTLGRLAQ